MNTVNKTLCSWSGGKDSCFALMQSIEQGYGPSVLLNILNEEGKISRSHGIPAAILQAQAAAVNLPIHLISSSWKDYEVNFIAALTHLKEQHNITHAVFGDIDLQAHRDWEEKVCAAADLKALLPLWQQDRKELVLKMISSGIKAIIVSCNELVGPDFLGRGLDKACMLDLEKIGVDVCGENGEFHTLVKDCPLFHSKIEVDVLDKVKHQSYWFSTLQLRF
jgi:diphthine-ammonia ligase